MSSDSEQQSGQSPANGIDSATPSRRRALARLGLAAGIAYATPTILRIDRSARGQFQTPCEDPPDMPGVPPPDCPEELPPGFPIPP